MKNMPRSMETSMEDDRHTTPVTKFIHLKTFSNYVEANIALTMLQDEGINCHAENEAVSVLMGVPHGIRLMVYFSQAERAAGLLVLCEEKYLASITCTQCHQQGLKIKMVTESHDRALRKLPFGRIMALMARLFTTDGTSTQVKHYECTNCSKEYTELP